MGGQRSKAGLIGGIAGGTVLAAIIAVAVFVFAPAIWSAATTEVAASDTTVTLESDGASADIPVPAGWSYRFAFGNDGRLTVESPDGVLGIELALLRGVDPVEAITAAASRPFGTVDREPSGPATLLHARTAGTDEAVGALASGEVVLTFVAAPMIDYDAEVAHLLAGIELAP